MNEFIEIAYAAAAQKLCLFTGTGFSKSITNNEAPSWQQLLESCCDLLENGNNLKLSLFPENNVNPLGLEEAAQIIAIELESIEKNIHHEIAKIIQSISLKSNYSAIEKFLTECTCKVITTNYDKLLENIAGNEISQSLAPGRPIPRMPSKLKVYHVHGSIDSPENMIVTADDYFKFMNEESYFSKKLSTLLYENITVIIGYSLGDTNLKYIINNYKRFVKSNTISATIFFISHTTVAQPIKDYYADCYGIRVIDNLGVNDFFQVINAELPKAKTIFGNSIGNIRKVINDNHSFKSDYLKIENSFYEVISSLSAIGVSISDARVILMLGKIITEKIKLSKENDAWDQYEQLAKWLTYLATILDLSDAELTSIFLDATAYSMSTMSKRKIRGRSWHAYRAWNEKWVNLKSKNKSIIKKYIEGKNDSWSYSEAISIFKNDI